MLVTPRHDGDATRGTGTAHARMLHPSKTASFERALLTQLHRTNARVSEHHGGVSISLVRAAPPAELASSLERTNSKKKKA